MSDPPIVSLRSAHARRVLSEVRKGSYVEILKGYLAGERCRVLEVHIADGAVSIESDGVALSYAAWEVRPCDKPGDEAP